MPGRKWGSYGSPDDIFWAYVDQSGGPEACWEWQRSVTAKGYGQLRANGKGTTAHRYAYVLVNGPISPGMVVCHRCGNRRCVNPHHLYAGTPKQNTRDAIDMGTFQYPSPPRGSAQHHSRLSEAEVLDIYRRAHDGEALKHIARDYDITIAQVSQIKRGLSWGHITGHVYRQKKPGRPNLLTAEVVLEIYRRRKEKDSIRTIARAFGVSESTVLSIVHGRSWSYVTGHNESYQ